MGYSLNISTFKRAFDGIVLISDKLTRLGSVYVTSLARLQCSAADEGRSWHAHGLRLCLRVFHSDIPTKRIESKPLSLVTAQLQKLYGTLLLLV